MDKLPSPVRRLSAALLAVPFALPRIVRGQVAEPVDGGPFVPTPDVVVSRMLELAGVGRDDLVADLGSGDGRLVIEAARRHGARGLGVEREARLVDLARAAAEKAGVSDRVSFRQGDIFETDLRGATVVTLYLLPRLLALLPPKQRAELAPGARIDSHDYPLEPWRADRTLEFDVPEKEALLMTARTQIFLYLVRQAS
jgi:SAM-dependent methyltransferase